MLAGYNPPHHTNYTLTLIATDLDPKPLPGGLYTMACLKNGTGIAQ